MSRFNGLPAGALPWRGEVQPPVSRPKLPPLQPWKLGLGVTAARLRQAQRRAIQLLEGVAAGPVEALVLACASHMAPDYLLPGCGLLEHLQARLLGLGLSSAEESHQPVRYRWLVQGAPDSNAWHRPYALEPWVALRMALMGASEAEYEAVRSWAAGRRQQASLEERVVLAFLLPDEGWAQSEVDSCLAEQVQQWGMAYLPRCSWLLLASLKSPEDLERLCAASPYIGPPVTLAPTILANLGSGAWDWLIAQARKHGPEWLKPLLQRPEPRLSPKLAPLLAERALRPLVSEFFQRFPEVGIVALSGLAVSNHKLKDLARSQLTQLLRAQPVLPALESREQALCAHILASAARVLPEASAHELPAVLAQPPWSKKPEPRVRQAATATAQPQPFSEKIHLTASKGNPYFYEVPPPNGPQPSPAFLRLQKQLEQGQEVGLHRLDALGPDEALKLWLATPAGCWNASWTPLDPLLDRFGLEGLPALLNLYPQQPRSVLEVVARVESPRVAGCIAAAFQHQQHKRRAMDWMQHYPEAAIEGLIPLAVAEGPQRAAAEQALRWLANWKGPQIIRERARAMQVEAAVQEVLDFDPLQLFPARLPKLPAFLSLDRLPPVALRNGHGLPLSARQALLTMLAFSPLDPVYAGVEQVKQSCCPDSLEEFANELFQLWQSAGAPAKEKWCFLALGHFGRDATVRQLVPLLKAWPQEGLFARAELGLDVLAGIGTDLALMHVYQMSQRLKSKALQERAARKLEQISLRRGLSEEELADLLVSDLDLEPSGRCSLSYGARQFSVSFDEQLRPQLRDAQGRSLKDLPKASSQDDGQLVTAAQARWKGLKKDLKVLAQTQILRLERAMVSGRSWSPSAWALVLRDHPLMGLLARRLLWGHQLPGGEVQWFRIAEDGTLADQQDATWELPESGKVWLPHPLQIDPQELQVWSQLFADYAVLQPFPQLGRSLFRLGPEQRGLEGLKPQKSRKIHPGKLIGLETRGWRRGPAWDGGVCCEMVRPLPGNRLAHLEFRDGIYLGALQQSGDQELLELWVEDAGRRLTLGELSEVDASELWLDWQSLQ